MWNSFYVEIFSCEISSAGVAAEEISVMIMTYEFDYPFWEDTCNTFWNLRNWTLQQRIY